MKALADYEEQMRALIDLGDTEVAHGDADDILVEFLRKLGYGALCDLYDRVPKWFA